MPAEDIVPSAPLAVDLQHVGGRIFERIRRANVGPRSCAPCDNTWIAVDRIIHDGRVGLLFHRNHECMGGTALREDLVVRDLSALGFEARRELHVGWGHIDVITGDCPGVRLRALVEVLKASESSLPRDVAYHIVSRTAELRAVWEDLGVEPGDTFVGFDGSLHLFPRLYACWSLEALSFNGDDVFDLLVVDDSAEQLGQLLCAILPPCVMGFDQVGARALLRSPHPASRRMARAILAEIHAIYEVTRPAVSAFLSGPPPTGDAVPALASIVQRCFPNTHARHRRVYESLGWDPAGYGRAREARILARLGGPRRRSDPGIQPGDAWLAYRTRLLARLSEGDSGREPVVNSTVELVSAGLDAPYIDSPGQKPHASWWSRLRSRLRG